MRVLIAKKSLIWSLLILPLFAFADDTATNTGIINTQDQSVMLTNATTPNAGVINTAMTADQIAQQAAMWDLSTDDYQEYLSVMQNTPAGKWYPQLDPPEVLGITATNDQDRYKYALIEAKLAHDQLDGIIAFDAARIQAFKELYPDLKPIQLKSDNGTGLSQQQTTPFALAGDQFLLFTSLNSKQGISVLSQLITLQNKTPGLVIYIYIVGTADNNSIEAWAKANNLPQAAFQNHTMYLDIDQGGLQKVMSNAQSNYTLPVLVRQRNGQQTVLSNPAQLAGQMAGGGGQ